MFYTYSIKNIDTGKFYIGCRTAKCMLNCRPEDDLGIHYFSSTTDEELKQAIKDGRVEYHVLQEYDDTKVCWKAEQQLIALYWKFFGYDMSYNHSYINCKGEKVFSTCGISPTKEAIEKGQQTRKNWSQEKKDDYIKRQKESHIGQTAWNKGLRGCQIPWNKGKQGLQEAWNKGKKLTEDQCMNMRKPKTKFYWQTPEGEIVLMDKGNAIRFHPDWILIGTDKNND